METRANRCIGRHWSCFWTSDFFTSLLSLFLLSSALFYSHLCHTTLCLSFITPINLFCGLPLFLLLGSSKFNILCPVQPLPKPFQPRLPNFPNSSTWAFTLIFLFVILSLKSGQENLSIFNLSLAAPTHVFLSAQLISKPDIKAVLTNSHSFQSKIC